MYYFEDDTNYSWGENSEEKIIQTEREKKGFQSLYFKLEDIPNSPAEPDPETISVTKVKPIPYQEFYSQNPKAVDKALDQTQANRHIPSSVHRMGYQVPVHYPFPAAQQWNSHNQYINQMNPPQFRSQNNFVGGVGSANGYGTNWGNSYQRTVCENYKMGICTNGSQCPNSHSH